MTMEDMERKLRTAFPEADIAVLDLTGTQDHFEVRVRSSTFKGKSRLEQQKMVMAVFDGELKSGQVHALAVKTFAD